MREIVVIVIVGVVLAALASCSIASIEKPDLNEYYHLGQYYANTGQYASAVANYRDMIGKHPNTREAERGWLNLGSCYYRLMLKVRAELAKARERPGVTAGEIEQFEARVQSYLNDSLSSCRKVIAQFPGSKAKAIVMMGMTYAALGPDGEANARRQFQKVVDNYPEEAARAQVLLGDTFADAGDREAAARAYGAAVSSFPEVASLALLKMSGLYFDSGDYARGLDGYEKIINSLGIDGAYNDSYKPVGSVMKKAMTGRGAAERALGNVDGELAGYREIISRYPGTNTAVEGLLGLAGAYWSNENKDEAEKLLRGTASESPGSIWAVKSLLRLAELQGASNEGAATYRQVIDSFPQSRFWVDAQMKLAAVYLELAEEEGDPVRKKELRGKARSACNAVMSAYPFCPEGDEAREYLKKKGL